MPTAESTPTLPNLESDAPCPGRPAAFEEEIARFRAEARPGTWDGPRYRVRYWEVGQGPPLLIVRGIAGAIDGFALLLNRLGERFRATLYDYPGDEPGDGARLRSITHDDLVSDALGLLDHLGVGRAFVLGISFGSTVTLKMLGREPRRFPKAVLQGGFAHRRLTGPERVALALGRQVPGEVRRLPFRERALRWNFGPEFPSIIADRWPILLEHSGRTPIAALAHRTAMLNRLDLRGLLPGIAAELLLIQGREDRLITIRDFEPLRRGLPRARPLVLPNVGHQLHYTAAETLAGLAGQFLIGCPEGGDCGASVGEARTDPR